MFILLLIAFLVLLAIRIKFPDARKSFTYWAFDAILWTAFTALYIANPMNMPNWFAALCAVMGFINIMFSVRLCMQLVKVENAEGKS